MSYQLPDKPPPPAASDPPEENVTKVYECLIQVGGLCKVKPGDDLDKVAKQFLYDAVSDMLMRISLADVAVRGDQLVFLDNKKTARIVEPAKGYNPS